MNMPGERKQRHSRGYRIFLGGAKTVIFILVVVLLIMVVIYVCQRSYSLGYESTTYEPIASESDARKVDITITADMSASDIGELLINEGVIEESLQAFLIQDRLSGLHGEYIPGTYSLSTSQTVDEILQIICTEKEEEDDS